jgi:hypothetical protein
MLGNLSVAQLLGVGYGAALWLIIISLAVILIFVACWVLHALGFFEVAKRSPHADKAWMAWVPFCRQYLLGLIVPETRVGALNLNSFPLFLAALPAALCLHRLLAPAAWLALYALLVLVNLEVFRRYRPNDAVVLAIFYPVGYLIIRNQVMGRVTAAPQIPPQGYPGGANPGAGYAPGQPAYPQQPPYPQQPHTQQSYPQQPYAQPSYPQQPPVQPGGYPPTNGPASGGQ